MLKSLKLKPILGLFSIAILIYCLAVYIYMQANLTPALLEPTRLIITFGNIAFIGLLIVGVYHLVLLRDVLKLLSFCNKRIYTYSLFIVLISTSGILLLADITNLSDIGKEYRYFDVSPNWIRLYAFTALHIGVVIGGSLFTRHIPQTAIKLFVALSKGNKQLFIAMHQIGFFCSLLSILGITLPLSSVIDEPYKVAWMIALSLISIFSYLLFCLYWVIKNRKKPLASWFDEKQMADSTIAAFFSMALIIPTIVVMILLDFLKIIVLPTTYWLSLLLFIYLLAFCSVVLYKTET